MALDRSSLLDVIRRASQSNQELESELAMEFIGELRAQLSEEGDPIAVAWALINTLGFEKIQHVFGETAAQLAEAWQAATELSQNLNLVREAATPPPTPAEAVAAALEPLNAVLRTTVVADEEFARRKDEDTMCTCGHPLSMHGWSLNGACQSVEASDTCTKFELAPPPLSDPTYREVLDEVLASESARDRLWKPISNNRMVGYLMDRLDRAELTKAEYDQRRVALLSMRRDELIAQMMATLPDYTEKQIVTLVLYGFVDEWSFYTDDDIRRYLVACYEQSDQEPNDGFLSARCASYGREIDAWDREALKAQALSLNEDEEHTMIRMADTLGRVRPGRPAEGDDELKPRDPRWEKYTDAALIAWLMSKHHYGALEDVDRDGLITEIVEQNDGDEDVALENLADDVPF